MSRPVRRLAPAFAAAALVLLGAPSVAPAQPEPFGRTCTAREGVRFCPTAGLEQRVRSFDGVPIDVDVTLPATGDGPFPTILLLHGLGQTKTAFQRPDQGYSNWAFARRGYAVVTPTARGFGRSCGLPETRTAGCARGWARLNDIRYEVRDIQRLVGLLVDQRVVRPDAIGSTGVAGGCRSCSRTCGTVSCARTARRPPGAPRAGPGSG